MWHCSIMYGSLTVEIFFDRSYQVLIVQRENTPQATRLSVNRLLHLDAIEESLCRKPLFVIDMPKPRFTRLPNYHFQRSCERSANIRYVIGI